MLLDQEGLEVDPVDRLEADIPLHKAVRFVNGLEKDEWEAGAGIVELLLDAGADPRFVLSPCHFSSTAFFSVSSSCAVGIRGVGNFFGGGVGGWEIFGAGWLCYPFGRIF